jgi:hypothetical protein
VGAVDAAEGTKVEKEKDWRHKYTKCVGSRFLGRKGLGLLRQSSIGALFR